MVKTCQRCGRGFSFFQGLTGKTICNECLAAEAAEKMRVEAEHQKKLDLTANEIIGTKKFTEQHIELLKNYNKSDQIRIFSKIWENFTIDKEMDKNELDTLILLQQSLGLSNEEIQYQERIMPYQYIYLVRTEDKLPVVTLQDGGGGNVALKKGEIAHFATAARLKEIRIVELGYSGGSHGVSLRIMKGVSYRVGSHKGHIFKEERMVETSKGHLILTNKRLIFHPFPGNKAVSMPLGKITSYNCYGNGVEIFKEGREKAFFFQMENSGTSEIAGICLGFLFEHAK
jgi:uncharacterized Zn finger protein (UPF0148 family)